MRIRTRDLRTSHPGTWLNLYGVTTTALADRYFRPTGQWHTGIGTVHYARTPQCVTDGQTGSYDYMWDDDASRPSTFNTCYHIKEVWNCPMVDVETQGRLIKSSAFVEGTVYTKVRMGAKNAAGYGIDNMPAMATDSQLLAEALSTCQPDLVRDTLNVTQEIGEMLEVFGTVKSLVKSLHKLLDARDARYLTRNWFNPASGNVYTNPGRRFLTKGAKAIDSLSLRDWLHLAVQLDLGYKFAVKPFISTMNKIVSIQERVHDVLKRVTGEVTTLHGTSRRTGTVSFTSTGDPFARWGNTRTYTKIVCAQVKVQYTSKDSDALRNGIKAALTGRTLRHVPSAAWELIPLSFICDMMVDFGGFLKQLALKPIADIEYTVLDSGWSWKTIAHSEGWVDPFSAGAYYDHKRILGCPLVTGSLEKTTYYRKHESVNLASFVPKPPNMHWPSLAQCVSIAEVAYSIASIHRELIRKALR